MKITIHSITKDFGSFDEPESIFRAVDSVSLEVREGELVTLLGPSGCGKTTLLRMLAGFEDPTSGDILFGERRMNDIAPNKRNVAMVFQSYAIFPHLNVRDNIAFGLKLQELSRKEIRERTGKAMELVGLEGLGDRQPSQLSGGQQQRVALARAIIMEPSVLLFDEPLSNLDAKLREQMRVDIRNLQQRLGITSIYVTHDQIEAMSISDRVVVMNRGHIEQIGTPRELYARPVNRFVASFIGKAAFLDAARNASGTWTLLGKSWKPEAESPSEPGQYSVMIRPEAVRLSSRTSSGNGNFTGKILRATYLGSLMEYEVDLPETEPITVHIPNPFEEEPLPPGSEAELYFLPQGLHFLPQEK
ncbi:MAG TPA: ABC transporter ATP-binding protein [Synergistaceae bacterium]|nr:ABC transporter ATP-binding protein [Synergistaceae bacterium]HPQ38331.1 ABC transporter ATP-binding protein [Synergistaceae bacterium]